MKRPMATIGFSMLVTFLLITNITHKMTIALLIGAIVVFCLFIIIKKLRKYLSVIFALFGAIAFTFSFVLTEFYYFNEKAEMEKDQLFTGVVCEIPRESDYAFSYIIKPENKSYKIRYVSQSDILLREGDYVKIEGTCETDNQDEDMFGNSLSSKVYFTFFESDECNITKTGEVNYYYKNIGAVKRAFSEIITKYLPGRNGAMAMAITIGDKSELNYKVTDYFNYCGTSHLLVISGLHLTLVSTFIVKFLYKFSKLRKYSPYIGLVCLLLYSAVTGFSVSVLRAGGMVGAVLAGKLFNRDADSINSIGLAVAFILLFNPFAPFSVALWLSVLSTLGILAYSGKIAYWINEKIKWKPIFGKSLYHLFVTSFSISFSTMVFTLPVFIFKLKMISVVTVITNLIMVDLALVMMATTFFGVFSHIIFLRPISQLCFMITGIIGEFLHVVAEKIGMAEWSTISLNHKYYDYFFIVAIICIVIIFIAEKHNVRLVKHMTVALSVMFVLLTVYCVSYDYNTPSVEVVGTDKNPVITVNYKGETVLIGTQKKKYINYIKDALNKHNKKQIDMLIVTEKEDKTISEIIGIYDNFGEAKTGFLDESPGVFSGNAQSHVRGFSMNENVVVEFRIKDYLEIKAGDKCLVITECKNIENNFENIKECDIMILYGKKSPEYSEVLKENLNDTQIIVLETNEKATISF